MLTIVAVRPLSCLEFSGTVCAALMEASQSAPLSAVWHLAQALSGCAPPAWFAPVVKFTSSWQEPHAPALGCVYHTADFARLAVATVPSWQFWQLRMSCGNATVLKSFSEFALPMIWYGAPLATVGRCSPMWILWIITLKSTVLPVSGSVVCGWWQRAQSLTSWREPPCAPSGSWQLL